jgi:hypothetical protein
MRNRKFRNRETFETELNIFFASKYHESYRCGIYKLISRWGKIFYRDGDYFSESNAYVNFL